LLQWRHDDLAHRLAAMTSWRSRYETSGARTLVLKIESLDFGSWILGFGATLMLSVLPIVILLSAFANVRVEDDIARHLGLSRQGTGVVEGLFKSEGVGFNVAVLLSLVLSFVGSVGVAGSVQALYERAFDRPHRDGIPNKLRCATWVLCTGALLILDGAISRSLRDAPGGALVLGIADFVGLILFFSWTMHFLLAGYESWTSLWRPAVATSALWTGLGVFASFYFSSTIVSDSRLYGTIGVVFSLLTWFIAVGAVIALGAALGVMWEQSRARGDRPR
jgi:membrane protein